MKHWENEYKPISFWSWNGDMQPDEIRWQISELNTQGFGGFFIHSRAGLLIPYMGEEWFAACQVAIEEAQRFGMDVWLYDEDGWPSGFAGGIVPKLGRDYQSKYVRFSFGFPQEKGAEILSAYRKTDDEHYYRIPIETAAPDDLYCYYMFNSSYVDLLNPKVTECFINNTHEIYAKHFKKYFGNVIKGIFTDEPQLSYSPNWSVSLPVKYEEKYNRDILDEMWLLFIEGENYRAFRYRFWETVSDLMCCGYTKQINGWCQKNNLYFTGHFACEDGLSDQVFSNGGVMRHYKEMSLPAIDHLGRRYASPVLMKQISSVAHRMNLPYIMSESCGCSGWDVTFDDLISIMGWQSVLGVNTYCLHLSAYSILGRRKRDYPAFFSYQEPWWKDFKYVSYRISYLNSVLSRGKRETKVAVIHPIRSCWCEAKIMNVYNNKMLSGEFRRLVENLIDLQIDFDLIDEEDFGRMKAFNDGCFGDENVKYSMLIVPFMKSVTLNSANKILEIGENGSKILFITGRPEYIAGEKSDICERLKAVKAEDIQNSRNILQKYFRAFPVQEDIRLLDCRMQNDISGVALNYVSNEDGTYSAFLFNYKTDHLIETVIRKKGKYNIVRLGDNGDKRNLECCFDGYYTYAKLSLPQKSGVLLSFNNEVVNCGTVNNVCVSQKRLPIDYLRLTDSNALTVDYGCCKINDGKFSEKKPIIHIIDEIYKSISSNNTDSVVTVKYEFETDFQKIPDKLMLAVEKNDSLIISVNGNEISKECGWWIDRGIRLYNIGNIVKNGINNVSLIYHIKKLKNVKSIKGKFENERNRFFYEVEPESIYILGDFDVSPKGNVYTRPGQSIVSWNKNDMSGFKLTDFSDKHTGNMTRQGLWFYRGNFEYGGKLFFSGDGEVRISADETLCTYIKAFVNGNYAGMILSQYDEINITPFLNNGENDIKFVAYGNNRNLLGPHHHKRGQLYFVGPSSFNGKKGFEDFVSPEVKERDVWTDNYSFSDLSVGGITVKEYL